MDVSPMQHRRRYQYLAYCAVRDAIGFYLGIPKFLANSNIDDIFNSLYKNKIAVLEKKKKRELTDDERIKCRLSVDKYIVKRRQELLQDFEYCQEVLFTENLWLDWLDLNPEFLKQYLDRMPPQMKEQLSVTPRWTTRDHALSRPYINDDFQMSNLWQ